MKKIFALILFFISLTTFSQTIPNGSFEDTDSLGNLLNWKINNGNIHQINSTVFYGIPFTATDQFYFLSVQNDTISAPIKTGNISNTFSLNNAPPTLGFEYFYAPTFFTQRFKIEILFTKWRNNNRDTILFSSNLFSPKLDSLSNLLVMWNTQKIDLQNSYRDTAMPDSASITIQNDVVAPYSNTTLLLLDNFYFNNWKVGVDGIKNLAEFTIFPNPANEKLTINFELNESQILTFRLFDVTGHLVNEITNQNFNSGKNEYQINTKDIPSGLYFIELEGNQFTLHKKLIISH